MVFGDTFEGFASQLARLYEENRRFLASLNEAGFEPPTQLRQVAGLALQHRFDQELLEASPIPSSDLSLRSTTSSACFNSAAARPLALSIDANALLSESICRAPAINACSISSAEMRHPPSRALLAPLTNFA
jgi:hypothetical protein